MQEKLRNIIEKVCVTSISVSYTHLDVYKRQEVDSQRHLCKFGTHAESGRTPHPEDGSRAADGNRSRHSCDISGSHCSGPVSYTHLNDAKRNKQQMHRSDRKMENRRVTMNNKTNLLELEEHMYPLVDVKTPNVFRNLFPYSEVPKIAFNDRVVPHHMPEEIWITDTTFRDGQQSRCLLYTSRCV